MVTVNFKINLVGTGWDDVYPDCAVYINDVRFAHGAVTPKTCFEFNVELEDDAEHELKIRYLNRDSLADVVRDEAGNIIKNRQFEIESIFIDDIELENYNILYLRGETKFSDSHYVQLHTQDPKNYPLTQTGNTVLGTECTWNLKFGTPIFIWLLGIL